MPLVNLQIASHRAGISRRTIYYWMAWGWISYWEGRHGRRLVDLDHVLAVAVRRGVGDREIRHGRP